MFINLDIYIRIPFKKLLEILISEAYPWRVIDVVQAPHFEKHRDRIRRLLAILHLGYVSELPTTSVSAGGAAGQVCVGINPQVFLMCPRALLLMSAVCMNLLGILKRRF